MSENAVVQVDKSAAKLIASTRISHSFQALRAGTASERLFGDWLTQTALYSEITAEVLETAAQSLKKSGVEELLNLAADFSAHGKEEGEENPVILDDLGILGIDLKEAEAIPPIATYRTMLRSVASDTDWAIGVFGLIRTLELLAQDCAKTLSENLRLSTSHKIRNALKFVEAHQDEEDHLKRTESVIVAVPPKFDHAIMWCGEMACLLYEGLLSHFDAKDYHTPPAA